MTLLRHIQAIILTQTKQRSRSAKKIVAIGAAIIMAFCSGLDSSALNPEAYAKSSVLSSGKWVRIKVAQTGMQTLSAASLRQMGFADPTKVNVYGYGGKMISDLLNSAQNDDLPMLPVIRLADGLMFYGVNSIGQKDETSTDGLRAHVSNAYSDDSYYFLSDRQSDDFQIVHEERNLIPMAKTVNSFRRMLVHEKDQTLASYMTRTMVGEDFRAATTQQFPFDLPGKANDEIQLVVSFVTNTSSSSSLNVMADNNSIANNVQLQYCGSEQLTKTTRKTWKFNHEGDKINVQLGFKGAGVIKLAALDYIEVHYNRQLKLTDSFLCFDINSGTNGYNVELDGVNESTRIWDVTNSGKPIEITYTRKGDTALFHSPAGCRDYVAFQPTPTSINPASAGKIANQDIHAMDVPDMLIITPQEYLSASERIATLHRDIDNMKVHVLTPEAIYNEFSSGVRDLGAFRKVLKMWYDRGEQDGHRLKYCLLMGRTSNDCKSLKVSADGVTYPVMLSWQNYPDGNSGESELSAYTTDDYIAMLDDDAYGSFQMGRNKVNIAVGRFPVKSLTEANIAADKLEKYMRQPRYGDWRNRYLIIADNADGGRHLDQGESVYAAAQKTDDGRSLKMERLYLDAYPLQYTASGKEYTQPREIYYDLLNRGVSFIEYLGHGNTRGWGHERLMLWDDLTNLKNKNLPVIFAATCEFGRWDDTSVSGAENMWLNPNGGAIAFIGTTRKVYVDENGTIVKAIAQNTFNRDSSGHTKRLGDFLIEGKNALSTLSDQRFRYNIIGDPALKMLFHENRVKIDKIEGAQTDGNGKPVVSARSKFTAKGSICDSDGNTLNDFNGILEITLMDAEEVITTFGADGESGTDGFVSTYNDRRTVLYTGKTTVTNGSFELQVAMPSEIENNYSPALLSFYAYSQDGIEANGSFSDFYVYGYNNDAEEDNEGPAIERFTLNSDNFSNGDVTHDTPVVYATLSDPSGINLSQAGIGHKLTLVLDGTTVYDNLTSAYTSDPTDYTRGSLAYVMPTLQPGDHTLKLTAWDNANNSSSATIDFKVAVNRAPSLYDVKAYGSKDTSSVTFVLEHDRPEAAMTSTIEVFDLNGRKLWSATTDAVSELGAGIEINWDLKNKDGERVPRGIYIYRATIVTPEGVKATKSKKMAVAGEMQ
ncbi:MAG: type IX secretion system sortase PorU [Prevotella sp.]|nr:type IX secretion system sortase PorU [Bacteroides sp.]MCM1366316.1 type IX secretion system sortase PorU [Prevotella sp.]MCM1437120.1 type IX secretion system sortase PorU [Prevotella sp.]